MIEQSGMLVGPCDYCVSPSPKIRFWGSLDLVRTLRSGLGDSLDGGLGLVLGLDNINLVLYCTVYYTFNVLYIEI